MGDGLGASVKVIVASNDVILTQVFSILNLDNF